jgi:hypothetical protein
VANEVEIRVVTKGGKEVRDEGTRIRRHYEREGRASGVRFSSGLAAGVGKVGAFSRVAAVGLLGAAGAVVALGAGAVVGGGKLLSYSAKLQDLDAKARVVFEGQLPRVQKWASANAAAFGLSKRETVGLAANLADLLKPMGFTAKEATNMSLKMLDLSGALSKWSGGTKSAAEVSEILSSAMLGERDALKGLGIDIQQAEIDAIMLKEGKNKLTGASKQQAEALIVEELILKKSTDAQKAWGDGGKEAATKQHGLSSAISETKEAIVTGLQPVLDGATRVITEKLVPAVKDITKKLVEDLKSALKGAKEWWDKNKTSVETLATSLATTFGFAVKDATGKTDDLRTAGEKLKGFLTTITLVFLHTSLEILKFKIKLREAGLVIYDFILLILQTINVFDLLRGGSGHAADKLIADVKRMKEKATEDLHVMQDEVVDTQHAIDNLHGKNVPVNADAKVTLAQSTVDYLRAAHVKIPKLAAGSRIPGYGGGDRVPILAERGETVVSKEHTRRYAGVLAAMGVPGFQGGGRIGRNLDSALNADAQATGKYGQHTVDFFARVIGQSLSSALNAGGGGPSPRGANQRIVRDIFASMFGWAAQWGATYRLVMKESGFNNLAQNPTSTAFGMFQFLNSVWASTGIRKTSDPTLQSIAGGRYIRGRYGSPANALAFHLRHNWYGQGTDFVPRTGPAWLHRGEAVIPANENRRGGNTYNLNVNVAPGGNPRDVGAAIVESIRAYEKGSGKGWRSGVNA